MVTNEVNKQKKKKKKKEKDLKYLEMAHENPFFSQPFITSG